MRARRAEREVRRVKEVAPAAAEEVLAALKRRGIADGFRVEVRHRPDRPWVGWYRRRSQFRSVGPVFALNAGCLVRAGRRLEAEVALTLAHEYGHLVWEWAELRGPRSFLEAVVEAVVDGGEEAFAEEFAQALVGGWPSTSIEEVLAGWGTVLRSAQSAA